MEGLFLWRSSDENCVFHTRFEQQALFFFLQYVVKKLCIYLLTDKLKMCCSYYKSNYLFRFGLGTNFLFLNQYTENKHALSLLIKRDYLQHD